MWNTAWSPLETESGFCKSCLHWACLSKPRWKLATPVESTSPQATSQWRGTQLLPQGTLAELPTSLEPALDSLELGSSASAAISTQATLPWRRSLATAGAGTHGSPTRQLWAQWFSKTLCKILKISLFWDASRLTASMKNYFLKTGAKGQGKVPKHCPLALEHCGWECIQWGHWHWCPPPLKPQAARPLF